MTTFWILAAALVVVAVLFVVLPLLKQKRGAVSESRADMNVSIYRDQLRELEADLAAGAVDQAQYQSTRAELEKRLVADAAAANTAATSSAGGKAPSNSKWMVIAAAIAVPLLTVSLYFGLGKPEGLSAKPPMAEGAGGEAAPHPITPAQIEGMVAKLAERMKEKPDDLDGWIMLGRSYGTLRRFQDASDAYGKAVKLMPKDAPAPQRAQLLIDYADVLAMTTETRLQGEPGKLVLQAVKLDPKNLKGLLLAGTGAFQSQNYKAAIDFWQKAAELVPPGSEIANKVAASIEQAQKQMGGAAAPVMGGAAARSGGQAAASNPAVGGATVSGKVSLDSSLKSKVADSDTVFIFARDADQPRRPPLAILRKTVKDLPMTFTLDDSMGIMPMFKLSSASKVVVGARVSKSGNAMPAAGDFQGFAPPSAMGAKGLSITINSEVH